MKKPYNSSESLILQLSKRCLWFDSNVVLSLSTKWDDSACLMILGSLLNLSSRTLCLSQDNLSCKEWLEHIKEQRSAMLSRLEIIWLFCASLLINTYLTNVCGIEKRKAPRSQGFGDFRGWHSLCLWDNTESWGQVRAQQLTANC